MCVCSDCSVVAFCFALHQTVKLAVWRAPPLLIIQLKRFQYTQYSRRKLQNLVTFPLRGLDLSLFLAKERYVQPPPDLAMYKFLGGKVKAKVPLLAGCKR